MIKQVFKVSVRSSPGQVCVPMNISAKGGTVTPRAGNARPGQAGSGESVIQISRGGYRASKYLDGQWQFEGGGSVDSPF